MNLFLRLCWRIITYSALIIGGLSLYTFLTSVLPPRHISTAHPSDSGETLALVKPGVDLILNALSLKSVPLL